MLNPIKIFVDAHVFDKEHQGTKTFIREIYKRLSKKPDVKLFLAARNVDNLKNVFGSENNIEYLQYSSASPYKRLALELPGILKKIKPDYAHFQYVVPPIKYCKYIVTTHDLLFRDFPKEFPISYRVSKNILFKYSLDRADIITTVSDYSKEAINKHYNISLPRITIIPNGVSEAFFEEFDSNQSKNFLESKYKTRKYILYVSRIEPRKQQDILLRAYLDLELYKQNIDLIFIGHLSIVDKNIEALISRIPVEYKDHVKFFSGIDDDDLFHFYKGAELFAYPSLAEGFGIPPLEAGALGIPTICSNVTAMRDFTFFKELHITPNLEEFKVRLDNYFKKEIFPSKDHILEVKKQIQLKYSWDNAVDKLYKLIYEDLNKV